MFYIAKTKDKIAALKFLKFIRDNERIKSSYTGKLIKVYSICPARDKNKPSHISNSDWKKMQSDDRCEMRPDTWGFMYKVFKHAGVKDSEIKNISRFMFAQMKAFSSIVGITNSTSSVGSPAVGTGTYQLGLAVNTLALMQYMGHDNLVIRKALKQADKRTGHKNPYYNWLANGKKSTEYSAFLVDKYCNNGISRPYFRDGISFSPSYNMLTSGVQNFGGAGPYGTGEIVNGHECIAIINYLLE